MSVQDRPTAVELLAAVREFLAQDVLPGLEGRKRFLGLVSVNVLGIVERELASEEAQLAAEWERLGRLLGARGDVPATLAALRDAVRTRTEALCARIRAGEADGGPFGEAVRDHVHATIREKLAVANPRFGVGGG